jgi:hypothetical protein
MLLIRFLALSEWLLNCKVMARGLWLFSEHNLAPVRAPETSLSFLLRVILSVIEFVDF